MFSVVRSRSRGRKPHPVWTLLAPSTYIYVHPPEISRSPNPKSPPSPRWTCPPPTGQIAAAARNQRGPATWRARRPAPPARQARCGPPKPVAPRAAHRLPHRPSPPRRPAEGRRLASPAGDLAPPRAGDRRPRRQRLLRQPRQPRPAAVLPRRSRCSPPRPGAAAGRPLARARAPASFSSPPRRSLPPQLRRATPVDLGFCAPDPDLKNEVDPRNMSKSLRFCIKYPCSACHNFMCATPFCTCNISKCSS